MGKIIGGLISLIIVIAVGYFAITNLRTIIGSLLLIFGGIMAIGILYLIFEKIFR